MISTLLTLIIIVIIILIAIAIIRAVARFILALGVFALIIFLFLQVMHFIR
ncbi:MAG: hypothetical protein KKE20_04885 [Nanoarchaeota archaeon]|nr:hypothetical protein [Nanoarchaeota archaeon]